MDVPTSGVRRRQDFVTIDGMRIMAAGVVAFVVLSASVAAVASRGPAAASAPRFRATVQAQSRIPLAGTNWRFVVRAVDSAGRPGQGTALVRGFAGGGEAGHPR